MDVTPDDEYGHNEIFCLLWSIISHNRIYLKQGSFVSMQNIVFVITVKSADIVPERLRRLMGVVNTSASENIQTKLSILGNMGQAVQHVYSPKFKQWLSSAVSAAESYVIQAKLTKVQNFVAIPQILTQLQDVNMSLLLEITQRYGKCGQDQQLCLLQCISEQTIPYQEGRTIMEEGNKHSAVLPSFFSASTISVAKKMFQNQWNEIGKELSVNFVSVKEKAQQVESLLAAVTNFIPALCLFQSVFQKLDDAYKSELLAVISAVEVSLALSNGVVLLTQPNTFGFECLVVASVIMQKALFFVGNDKFSSQTVKILAEKVAG